MMSKLEITINPEYRNMVPRPPPHQYAALKDSIKHDGLLMPITINQDGVVLDGHTRYDICKELGIKPRYKIQHFDSVDDEKRFVVIINLSRRHLNLFQRCEVIFNWWKQQKEEGYRRRGYNTWATRRGKRYVSNVERLNKRCGEMLGCGHNTVFYAMYLLEHADERMKNRLRSGTLAIGTAYQQARNMRFKRPQEYGQDYRRYPICPLCGVKTLTPEETGCHVHTQLCCLECRWGL